MSQNLTYVPLLLPISQNYIPKQTASIYELLKKYKGTAEIFLKISLAEAEKDPLNSEKESTMIAQKLLRVYEKVEDAIESL